MSLLALLEASRRAGNPGELVAAIPYARHLGIDAELQSGVVVTRLRYSDCNLGNPSVPALHGGVVGALLETAAVLQLLWTQESVTVPKIINISVDYLRPAGAQHTWAIGAVTKQGRRIVNVSVEAWQRDRGRPVATADCHFLLTQAGGVPSVG